MIEGLKKNAVKTGDGTYVLADTDPSPVSPALKGSEGGYAMASELDAAKKIAQLPTGMQAKYSSLPNVAQRALIR